FCSEAIEGLFEQKEGRAVETLIELDTDFLKDHLSLQHPQIHLNSLAAAQPVATHYPHKKRNSQPLWRNISIAAALALGLGVFWLAKYGNQNGLHTNQPIAQQTETTPPATSINNGEREPLADNAPVSRATPTQQPEPMQPLKNGSDPKAPQTLLMADKKQDTEDARPAPGNVANADEAREAPRQKEEEVAVNAYKAATIDRPAAAPKPLANSEQIEKMPTRNTDGVASTSAGTYSGSDGLKVGGGRSNANNNYVVDGVQTKAKKATVTDDHLTTGDNFYNERKYNQALNAYKKELNSGDKSRRQKAGLMAARCYLALGQKTEAKGLLNDLVQNGSGGAKREAKRMLSDMGED
ncbi:MAG: tetratricopeptide repeat protein, partial [Sphingobacteriales bacterium]